MIWPVVHKYVGSRNETNYTDIFEGATPSRPSLSSASERSSSSQIEARFIAFRYRLDSADKTRQEQSQHQAGTEDRGGPEEGCINGHLVAE